MAATRTPSESTFASSDAMNVFALAQYTTLLTPDMASSNVFASETSPTYACTLSGKISRSLSFRTKALTV